MDLCTTVRDFLKELKRFCKHLQLLQYLRNYFGRDLSPFL